jgi:uncharacterized protein (DUF433 family)
MSLPLPADPMPFRAEPDGTLRVRNTRVLLDLVIAAYNDGAEPETIREMYSTLDLADVYAVLAYYLTHREEVDEYLRRREQEAERVREENLARFPPDGVRESLLARLSAKDGRGDAASPHG